MENIFKKSCLLIGTTLMMGASSSLFAQDPMNETLNLKCREAYPNYCVTYTTCVNEEKLEFDRMHNFCQKILSDDNDLNKYIQKSFDLNKRIKSNEDAEKVKKDMRDMIKDISELEKDNLVQVNNIIKYQNRKQDPNLLNNFFVKTGYREKDIVLSNNKSFYLFLLNGDSFQNYRDFYKKEILDENGNEKELKDFADKQLPKNQCMSLFYHQFPLFSLYEGSKAISEISSMLEKYNIKCI